MPTNDRPMQGEAQGEAESNLIRGIAVRPVVMDHQFETLVSGEEATIGKCWQNPRKAKNVQTRTNDDDCNASERKKKCLPRCLWPPCDRGPLLRQ